MSIGELACTYASLILVDDDISITAEKIVKLINAASIQVDSYWPSLFAKLSEKRNLEDLILSAGVGGGGGAAAPVAVGAPADGAGVAAAPPAAEEKKEPVKEEESDDDMGFSLFD